MLAHSPTSSVTPPDHSFFTPKRAVLWLIITGSIARLIAASVMGLGYGESYYFSCARHPDLSYFDQPPLSLWLGWLGMAAAGHVGPIALRAPFILLFAGTTWMMFSLTRRLFGDWPAFHATLLLNLSAVFTLAVASWLQPDGPLMFFWLACSLCLARIFFEPGLRRPTLWWLFTGLTLGLSLLSKYHALFLVLGAVIFCITSKPHRRWLTHPGPYLALFLAAAIFSPVLLWNDQHHWISFLWQSHRGVQSAGLRPDWLLRSIGGQALWLFPWIWYPLVEELARCLLAGRHSFSSSNQNSEIKNQKSTSPPNNPPATTQPRWFLACLASGPILLFTIIALYAPLGFHFHWQGPGYLMLFPALGLTVHQRLSLPKPALIKTITRCWLGLSTALTCAAILFLVSHSATGWWRSAGPQWLSARFGEVEDPTLEALDYHTLPQALAQRGLLNDPNLFVFTNRWFMSGKADYALRGRMPVLCFSADLRSFAFFTDSADWLGKDGLLVTTKKFSQDPQAEFRDYFQKITPLGYVTITRGGHAELTLDLYLCKQLKKPYLLPYR